MKSREDSAMGNNLSTILSGREVHGSSKAF